MASMSYCVFENTANDFGTCVEKLENNKPLSSTENEYKDALYELAKRYIKAYNNYKVEDKGYFLLSKEYFKRSNYSRNDLEVMVNFEAYKEALIKCDTTNDDYDCLRDAVEEEWLDSYEEMKEQYFIVPYGNW